MSIPKSALKLLPSVDDQLLLLDLLSRCKRPRTKMDWELMAQCFVGDAMTGRTLYDFYGILVENGCVEDGEFEGEWHSEREGVVHLDIDFASSRYQRARCKFMHKVAAFNEGLESDSKMDGAASSEFGVENVDLFLLYILVTKRGGFERIALDEAMWREIVEEMPSLFEPHSAVRRVHGVRSLYRRHLRRFEAVYFEADGFGAALSDDTDHFGTDLYLEECAEIVNVLRKYPLKRARPRSLSATGPPPRRRRSFWLEMAPNGNRLNGTIFGNAAHCHSGSSALSMATPNAADPRNERRSLSGSGLADSVGARCGGALTASAESECIDGDDDGDGRDRVDVGSVLESMVSAVVDVGGDGDGGRWRRSGSGSSMEAESARRLLADCGLKGLHPFTRRLMASMLRECESTVSLRGTDRITVSSPESAKTASNNPRKQSQRVSARKLLLNGSKSLSEYEVNWIIDELIVKMLKMRCCLGVDDGDSSMMRSFESGLCALKRAQSLEPDGYALYRVRSEATSTETVYFVYYQRIVPSMEQFVRRSLKMAHNFLSHPVGRGLMAMPSVSRPAPSPHSAAGAVAAYSDPVAIPKGTFLGEVAGDLHSVTRWMERAFCGEKLAVLLRSGSPLRAQQPFWMELAADGPNGAGAGYKVLGVSVSPPTEPMDPRSEWIRRGRLRVNHCCDPNCVLAVVARSGSVEGDREGQGQGQGQRLKLGLFSGRDIVDGEELTADYRWSSGDGDGCCRECVCCCGQRRCRGTFVRLKRAEIEDEQYLVDRHHFVGHRLVQLLMASLSPLTDAERAALDRLRIDTQCLRPFGQWMPKYIASTALFIEAEHRQIARRLFERVNRRNEYTLTDAQRDADEVMLRRMRALSVTMQRIAYFLEKQAVLSRHRMTTGHRLNGHGVEYEFALNAAAPSMFALPPVRFAEIDEVVARLWNDSDSLIHRLLHSLKAATAPSLFQLVRAVVAKEGLIEESQSGLHLVRRRLTEIAKMLRSAKSTKIHRHNAAADVLFLYGHTLRFAKCRPFWCFAAEHSDHGVISSFRSTKKMENRYLTRSVRKESERRGGAVDSDRHRHRHQPPPPPPPQPESEGKRERAHSDSVRFVYPSHFPLLTLLSWHRQFGPDGGGAVSGSVQREFEENVFGVALLPDIESCFDSECKGRYMESHRNYLFQCLLRRTKWTKQCYTKQYEERASHHINSCPVPQFTFMNALGLFGSPVLDSFIAEHTATTPTEREDGQRRLRHIVRAMRNDFDFEM